MAIISAGYDGTVDEQQWARMVPKTGAGEYGIDGAGDFKVTAVANQDRTVSVSTGTAWGRGVLDVMDANVTLKLDSVSSGSRWDMIVLRRDWQPPGGNTSVQVIKGGTSMSLPTRNWNPGVIDDQPIALVRVDKGSTTIGRIIDLRVWVRNGGATANDELVRSYLNQLGTQIEIYGTIWQRRLTDNGTPEWVDINKLKDTEWATKGWAIRAASGFKVDAYRLRMRQGELQGRLDVKRTSSKTITVGANGNIDDTLVATLTVLNPSVAPWPVDASQPGINEWFARLGEGGSLTLTHGTPGAVLRENDALRFIFRVPMD